MDANVALRKESVDRNLSVSGVDDTSRVALRKESVDRNLPIIRSTVSVISSLSARRAWIEIVDVNGVQGYRTVALRKESVDRNNGDHGHINGDERRSPQGERG